MASTSVAVRNTIRAGQVRVRGGRAAYYQQPTDAKPENYAMLHCAALQAGAFTPARPARRRRGRPCR